MLCVCSSARTGYLTRTRAFTLETANSCEHGQSSFLLLLHFQELFLFSCFAQLFGNAGHKVKGGNTTTSHCIVIFKLQLAKIQNRLLIPSKVALKCCGVKIQFVFLV